MRKEDQREEKEGGREEGDCTSQLARNSSQLQHQRDPLLSQFADVLSLQVAVGRVLVCAAQTHQRKAGAFHCMSHYENGLEQSYVMMIGDGDSDWK